MWAYIKSWLFLSAISSKRLHLLMCAYTKTFSLLVCAYIKCLLSSKRLLLLVCAYIKTFALLVCAYIKCLLSSKRLLLPVCALIKSVLFFMCFHKNVSFDLCAPTSHLLMFGCTILRLRQMPIIFACATTSKCLLSLVCASIKIFAFSTSKWLHVIVYANI